MKILQKISLHLKGMKKSSENESIPTQFEFVDTLWDFKDHPKINRFVTILDEFTHHYTKEKMYYIRIEFLYKGSLANYSMVEYKTVGEGELKKMIETRKV